MAHRNGHLTAHQRTLDGLILRYNQALQFGHQDEVEALQTEILLEIARHDIQTTIAEYETRDQNEVVGI